MIKVTFVRREGSGEVVSFRIEGHAQYAKPGKDIVCAAVSAISVGTVNSIEALAGVQLPATMKSGWLQSDIPHGVDASVNERVQLLIESMAVMLGTIAESYGRHVVINDQYLK